MDQDALLHSYLAGVLDSDGCFTIKKSTARSRAKRGRDCVTPIYQPRVILKQVDEVVPRLLADTFGGVLRLVQPAGPNFKPIWTYQASDAMADRICRAVLPYLRIKPERCRTLIELQSLRKTPHVRRVSWWFEQEHPGWRTMEMLTTREVAERLNFRTMDLVSQCLANGTIIALPLERRGSKAHPRFPKLLIDTLANQREGVKRFKTAPQLVERYESLYMKIRTLNRIGIHGTCINHRTGSHATVDGRT